MSAIKVDTRKSRAYTCAVLELVDQGALDQRSLINDLLGWMDEADVKQFCETHLSELFEEGFGDEDDSDEDDDEEWDAMEPSLVDAEPELEDYASSECPDDCSQCEYTGRCKTEAME